MVEKFINLGTLKMKHIKHRREKSLPNLELPRGELVGPWQQGLDPVPNLVVAASPYVGSHHVDHCCL